MGRAARKRHRKKMHKAAEITETEERLKLFKAWMQEQNCLFISQLIPYNFNITGRGLMAARNIEADKALIKIPFNILITTFTAAQSDIKILFLDTDYYTAQFVLSIFLIYERHLAHSSKWFHYLQILPKAFANPEFCSDREKSVLPTFILDYIHSAHKIKNDFLSLRKSLATLALNENDLCPHCNISLKHIMTFNMYRWAYYVVNTRAVYLEPESNVETMKNIKQPNNIALAPFLDLFNHNFSAKVSTRVVTNTNGQRFYELITLKPCKKESQIFINYGSHNSLRLYVDYGFFIPNNPLDEVSFAIDDIKTYVHINKQKLEFIECNHFDKDIAFTRTGLNYNAIRILFLITTNLPREHWSLKIYNSSYTPNEFLCIYNIAIKILEEKTSKFFQFSSRMVKQRNQSLSFSVACCLLAEYCTLLGHSMNYIKTHQKMIF